MTRRRETSENVESSETLEHPESAVRRKRSRARVAAWAVPSVVALAVIGGIGAGAMTSGAASGLEPKSAEQILTEMQQARVPALSGTVVAKADLGLPEVPGMADSPELTSLVSGSHTMRVWYDGPEKVRLAKLGGAGETDVIRNGREVWMWSSQDKTAVHQTLPNHARPGATGATDEPMPAPTPAEASQQILATLGRDSTVTTDAMSRVAGRDAYEIVLTPKQEGTLVENVRLAVDGETMMPLRVRVNSTKLETPAYEVGFTDLQLGDVEDRMFSFTPPAGTTVTRRPAVSPEEAAAVHAETKKAASSAVERADEKGVVTKGQGWDRVVVGDLGENPLDAIEEAEGTRSGAHGVDQGQLTQMLQSLPRTSGAWGSGQVLEGTLFSAVLTDDGRVAVGAVPSTRLLAALGSGR